MDSIINILLLIIIFVFDPLAISMVVAANFAFDQANRKNLYNEFEDEIKDSNLDLYTEDDEKRMDIIGRNGNDGEHYEEDEDVSNIEVSSEIISPKKEEPNPEELIVTESTEIPHPVKIVQKGPSLHRVLFSDGTEKKVSKDDNIIRYL